MSVDNLFQIIFLVIGFVFGILTSIIKINIEAKKQSLQLLKEWLSDYEGEFRFYVDFHENFHRAQWLWGNGKDKELILRVLRKNAQMFGLFRSKAVPKNIRDAIEIVVQRRSQGQNILNEINASKSSNTKITDDQISKLNFHLSEITDSIEYANKIISEYENNPLKMFLM